MATDFGARDLNVLAGDAAMASGDYRQARMHYGAAAEMGLAAGQHNLAHLYQEGKGVAVNYAEAMKLYRKAAEQGASISQVALGLMYYHGQGVPRDYAEALKWLRRGAEQGFPAGEFTLGQMYANGTGVQRDLREAVKWFDRAAQKGYPGAAAAREQARQMLFVFDEAEKAGALVGGGRRPSGTRGAQAEGGKKCFIATAACGSGHAAEVLMLRRLRDEVLATSRIGRVFIAAYEAASPPVARFIEARDPLKAAIRRLVIRPLALFAAKAIGARPRE